MIDFLKIKISQWEFTLAEYDSEVDMKSTGSNKIYTNRTPRNLIMKNQNLDGILKRTK